MQFQNDTVNDIISNLGPYITDTLLNFLLVIGYLMATFLLVKSFLKFNFVKKQFNKYKFLETITLFLLGFLVSSGSFWYPDYQTWSYLFFVILFLIFGFNLGFWFVFGSIPFIIYNAMIIYGVNINNITNVDIYQLLNFGILFGEIIIFIFIHLFIKNKNNFIYFIFNIIIFSILLGVSLPIIFTQPLTKLSTFDGISISIDLGTTLLISFLGFALVKFLNKFIYKTEKLGISVSYKNSFINKKYANEQINNFIDANKISFAYIVKFSLLGIDPFITSYGYGTANKIKIKMINEAREQLKKYNGLFYMQGDDNEYFVMIPINNINNINLKVMKNGNTLSTREELDDLNFLEKILKEINNNIKKTINHEFKLNLFANTIIYGVTSGDFREINNTLEKINLVHSTYNENVVVLIDTNISPNKEFNQKNKALERFNKFGPNDIIITLHKKQIIHNQVQVYESDAALLKDFLISKAEIYELTNNKMIQSAIICHISAKSIKIFVNQKLNKDNNILIVDYPQFLLEKSDFNIYELISNITSYEILPNQIIFNVLINRQSFTDIFYENLANLAKENLKIAFTNCNNHNDQKIKKLNPIFL